MNVSNSRLHSAEEKPNSKIKLSKFTDFSIQRGGNRKEWAGDIKKTSKQKFPKDKTRILEEE